MSKKTTRRGWLQTGGAASAAALLSNAGATPLSEIHEEPPKDVYTRIGVEPFINCTATVTSNGGSRTLPEVIEAIRHASYYHVNMDELQEAAGKRIAKLLQVEHAMVSSGAAAALTHATAGCVAGTDPERMQQLPDMTGLKNEVIMPKSSRNGYDYAVRMVGLTTVEVRTADELRAAINDRTALVAMLGDRFTPNVELPLKEVAPIANKAGIPVLVDSAADHLMTPNPYVAEGADLVAYSGGKISRGPQGGGLLVGREELVRAAFANSAHHHAFGRPMKVSKEEIIGVLTAVETFFGRRDLQQEYREWEGWYEYITKEITKVLVRVHHEGDYKSVSRWRLNPCRTALARWPLPRLDGGVGPSQDWVDCGRGRGVANERESPDRYSRLGRRLLVSVAPGRHEAKRIPDGGGTAPLGLPQRFPTTT